MSVTIACEESQGDRALDISARESTLVAGLGEFPGFDLLSRRMDGEERAIEVKRRSGVGEVDISDNEWSKACNLRERYWLYVVFDCAAAHPRLIRIQDPRSKFQGKSRGFILDLKDISYYAESDNAVRNT